MFCLTPRPPSALVSEERKPGYREHSPVSEVCEVVFWPEHHSASIDEAKVQMKTSFPQPSLFAARYESDRKAAGRHGTVDVQQFVRLPIPTVPNGDEARMATQRIERARQPVVARPTVPGV